MKFKNKMKTQEKPLIVETPPPTSKVLTETQLQEHLKNLKGQLPEAQTKVVMLQGALQMVELQVQEMEKPPTQKEALVKNGQNPS